MKPTKPLPATAHTVTVMCKIPNGLRLRLQKKVKRPVAGKDGLEMVEFSEFYGRAYYVRGPAYPIAPPAGYPKPPVTEGGYAATTGIPADFWADWLEQNKHADYCRPPDGADCGFIYAEPDLESAIAVARENEKLLTGLQPMSIETDKNGRFVDPRAPRPLMSNMTHLSAVPEGEKPTNTSFTEAP